jgi:SNF2 family DNA or RNA helicase
LDALEDIVEAMQGKPLLIAYAYRHDIARIQERFKSLNPVLFNGADDLAAWNRGEIPLMLISPQGAGHGLNLQAGGDTLVWFNLPWSLELFQQTGARLHRQGQKSKTTTQHIIMTSDTIEKKVVAALNKKEGTQNDLMDAVRAEIKDIDISKLMKKSL